MSKKKDAKPLVKKGETDSDHLLAEELKQIEDEEKGAWKEREAMEEEAEAQRQWEKVQPVARIGDSSFQKAAMSKHKDAESLAKQEDTDSDRLLVGQEEDGEKGAWKQREAREEEAGSQRQLEKVERVVARPRAGSRSRVRGRRPSKKIKPPLYPKPSHSLPRRRSAVTSRLDVISPTSTEDLWQFELKGVQRTSTILGTGSYGSVLLLKYKGLQCAGKKVHNFFFENQSHRDKMKLLERFISECRTLSQLHHPHIVQFLGIYFEHDSLSPILVMEKLHTTLSVCIEKHGSMPPEIAYSILHDVTLGLCYLHGHNPPIVHRDLSSNNVLLSADMKAKISDLGVAKIIDLNPQQLTNQRTPRLNSVAPGTLTFMPPEALHDNPTYDKSIDVFSLGVMMIHIFSGQWPSPGEATIPDPNNPAKVIGRSEAQRRDVHLKKMGYNHPLMDLTCQCIHNDASQRPAASHVLQSIEEQKQASQVQTTTELLVDLQKENKELKRRLSSDLGSSWASCDISNEGAQGFEQSTISVQSVRSQMGFLIRANRRKSSIQFEGQPLEVRHPFQPGAKLEWKTCTSLPAAMYHGHAVAMKGMVYAGGGSTQGHDNIVMKYNIMNDLWEKLPPCPVTHFGMTKFDEKIVIVGGKTLAQGISNSVYSYNEDDGRWENTIEDMPTARHSPTVFSFRSYLFVCGGKDVNGISTAVEVYQAQHSSWSKCCSLPLACHSMTATVIQGICYLLGGFSRHTVTDRVFYAPLLDLALKSCSDGLPPPVQLWQRLSNIPQNCGSAAKMGGALLSVGGYHTFRLGLPKVYVYSQLQSSWIKLSDLPQDACVGTVVAELPSDELLVIGGATSNNEPRNTVIRGRIKYVFEC